MAFVDQAQTLRRLMQERERESLGGATVHALIGATPECGTSAIVLNLGAALARRGIRTMIESRDGFDWATQPHFLEASRGTPSNRPVSPRPNLFITPSRSQARPGSTVDALLIDAGSGLGGIDFSALGPAFSAVVVVEPGTSSLVAACGIVERARREAAVTSLGVVVNRVTDGAEARKAYFDLVHELRRRVPFADIELSFSGHFPYDEKIARAVAKRKYLLDLYSEAPPVRCLELLAKRLGCGESDAIDARKVQDEHAGSGARKP